jgi:hypothetical protein
MQAYGPLTSTVGGNAGTLRSTYAPMVPARPRETWRRFRDELFQQRLTLDRMLSEGFALLEERPGEELVLRTVGRFWRARGELCATNPVQFRAAAPSGTAKAAWNFEVGLRADSATKLRTETRVLCADVATRRRFRAYWMLIRPFSGLIRQEMLAAFRSAAE